MRRRFRYSPSDRLRRGAFVLAAALLLPTGACRPGEVARDELAVVEPPADLRSLDRTVRDQFEEIWGELQRLKEEPGTEATVLGDAWGRMGQWFDAYAHEESARLSYSNAVILDPDEPRWPYYLGILAVESGEPEFAAGLFRRSIELSPDEPAPRIRLGDLALGRQDLELAGAMYRAVLEIEPEHPNALLGAGRVELQEDDPEAAIEYLDRVLEIQPGAAAAHYSLALAWRRLEDEEQARLHLEAIPDENLDQVLIGRQDAWDRELLLLDRGALLLTRSGVKAHREGRHLEALVLLGRAVAADPEGAEKRINYGLALRAAGRPELALQELEKAVQLAQEGTKIAARAMLEKGRLLSAARRWKRAEEALYGAIEIDPGSIVARVELGRISHRQGRLEEAVSHYALAGEIDPSSVSIAFWHAAMLAALERTVEATRALDSSLKRLGDRDETKDLRALMARVLCASDSHRLRDLERAATLVRAWESEPAGEVEAFLAETVAMVAAARGRSEDAVAWQEAVVSAVDGLRPPSAAQIARRRLILYRRGRPSGLVWEPQEVPLRVPVGIP